MIMSSTLVHLIDLYLTLKLILKEHLWSIFRSLCQPCPRLSYQSFTIDSHFSGPAMFTLRIS